MTGNRPREAHSSAHELQPISSDNSSSAQRHPSRVPDPEGRTPPEYTLENDPYQLATKLKSAQDLRDIRVNTSRKCDGCGPLTLNLRAAQSRRLQKFYESQNDSINRMLKPVDEHVRTAREFQNDNKLKVQIATWGSLVANVVLAILQVYAASSSGSLSLFTTMADALFDPLSNITLMVSNRAVKRVDSRRFPSGKARIETVGNIVFCFLMNAVSWILIVVSIMQIVTGDSDKTFHLPSVIAVAVALVTKFVLFLYCWTLRNQYSQIHILWEDHRNDLFINSLGLFTSTAGSKINWLFDPCGALVLSVLISTLWLHTAYSEFQLLIGVSADPDMLQWITYICTPPVLEIEFASTDTKQP